jgi:hypothetical protein
MHEDKNRENRLRRMAARQGIRLVKSRRRDPQALDYGQFWLVDIEANLQLTGGQFGISLDKVEDWLTAEETAASDAN